LKSTVNVFAVADFHYPYGKIVILNRVYDAVSSLADTALFLVGEFFAAYWSWFGGQKLYFPEDFLDIIFGD